MTDTVEKALKSVFPGALIEKNSAGGLAVNAGPYMVWTEFHKVGWDGVQDIGEHFVVKLFVETGGTPHFVPISELIVPPSDLENSLEDIKETFREAIQSLGRVCGFGQRSADADI